VVEVGEGRGGEGAGAEGGFGAALGPASVRTHAPLSNLAVWALGKGIKGPHGVQADDLGLGLGRAQEVAQGHGTPLPRALVAHGRQVQEGRDGASLQQEPVQCGWVVCRSVRGGASEGRGRGESRSEGRLLHVRPPGATTHGTAAAWGEERVGGGQVQTPQEHPPANRPLLHRQREQRLGGLLLQHPIVNCTSTQKRGCGMAGKWYKDCRRRVG
jgi:hypothetical protein